MLILLLQKFQPLNSGLSQRDCEVYNSHYPFLFWAFVNLVNWVLFTLLSSALDNAADSSSSHTWANQAAPEIEDCSSLNPSESDGEASLLHSFARNHLLNAWPSIWMRFAKRSRSMQIHWALQTYSILLERYLYHCLLGRLVPRLPWKSN